MNQRLAPPVFILGLHRSGTTLLYQMLTASGGFHSLTAADVILYEPLRAEPEKRDAMLAALASRFKALAITGRVVDHVELTPRTLEEYGFILNNLGAGWGVRTSNRHVLEGIIDLLQRKADSAGQVLLKNPWDFSRGHIILKLFPDARLIYIHRNPFHVLSSTLRVATIMMTQSNPYLTLLSDAYARFEASDFPRRVGSALATRRPGVALSAVIERTAFWVRRYLRYRSTIPNQAAIDVRFEDLCRFPNETISQILAFLRSNPPPRDYAAMIGPHASRVSPEVSRCRPYILSRLSRYAASVGYDLPALARDIERDPGRASDQQKHSA